MDNDFVQYDLNTMGPDRMGKLIYEGDKYGYDYDINVHKGLLWSNYTLTTGRMHLMVAGKWGGTDMYRKGNMRNGMFAENSYGKSGTAKFMEGGGKFGFTYTLGKGNTVLLGAGYEWRAPLATTAFRFARDEQRLREQPEKRADL